MTFVPGWRPELESQHQGAFSMLACAAAPVSEPLPSEVLYPEVPIENQGPIGSCQGHALSTVLEIDHLIDTGAFVQLSRRFAYLSTQEVDGSRGSDCGSTISGGAVAASTYGIPLESDFPYWNPARYSPDIPQEVWQLAKPHKIRAKCEVPNWDFAHQFIGSRQGGVSFGIQWYESLANYDGSQEVVTRVSGRSLGGHAMCIVEYRTIGGTPIPIIRNSHGANYGKNGTIPIDPGLWERLVRESGFGAVGLTGLVAFTTRKYKHRDGGYT